MKRLSKESLHLGTDVFQYAYAYTYDSNGNILEKTKLDEDDHVISKDVYHYSAVIKDRLDRISRIGDGNETDIYVFTYPTTDQFRPSSITNHTETHNLIWHGSRLKQFGSYQYDYNEVGMRIKKIGNNLHVTYDVDGSMVLRSVDRISNQVMSYHFDSREQVIGFNYQGKEFFYQRNLLGEIFGIIDANGKPFVTYTYTAYGVPTIGVAAGLSLDETQLAEAISELNIYLYKGYVYDLETGLYYCQTRYYHPGIGRWLSIDDVSYLDPSSINGLNLYAYCGNNPVMHEDPSGHFVVVRPWFHKEIQRILFRLKRDIIKLKRDINNFDYNNENENVVLDSNYFSYYKGSFVIRHSIPNTTSCAIFKTIFLNRHDVDAITVKHEWGHTQQERYLGTPRYIIRIAIPSLYGYFNIPYEEYYSQPWEYSADILGGVDRGGYAITEDEAMKYLYHRRNLHHRRHAWPIMPNPLFPWP